MLSPSSSSVLLAIVLSTRPPADSVVALEQPTMTWLHSLVRNAPMLAREAPALIVATDDAEAASLGRHVASLPWPAGAVSPPRVRALERLLPNASLAHMLPERVRCIAPAPFVNVNDVLRYSAIWRSIKRAYGAQAAIEEFGASHAFVTDVDGYGTRARAPSTFEYCDRFRAAFLTTSARRCVCVCAVCLFAHAALAVFKSVSAASIVAHSSTVWYSDHRGTVANASTAPQEIVIGRPPRPDTNFRARAFCSVHPWVSALQSAAWEAHAARFAIGRDWAAWEAVAVDELALVPGAHFRVLAECSRRAACPVHVVPWSY